LEILHVYIQRKGRPLSELGSKDLIYLNLYFQAPEGENNKSNREEKEMT
jgi:hypothetical protein